MDSPDGRPAEGTERALRVLQVVRPAVGGMKDLVFELCRGLRSRGHSVEIACPIGSEVSQEAASLGFRVHEIVLVGPLRPMGDVRGIAQIAGIVRRGRFDLVHAHGFKAGLVARLGGVIGGCRARIVTVHNQVGYAGSGVSGSARAVYRFAEKGLARITSRVIAVSDALRRELIEEYGLSPDLVVTVHNGVDVLAFLEPQDVIRERTRLDVPAGHLVVGTAARFAIQKGLGYFVEAAIEIGSRRNDVVFVLGGDGPLRSELEASVADAEAGRFVRMPGFIQDMPAFLAALDMFVSSSLSEGLPLTFVQAGAAKCPVVATSVGGTPEIVRHEVSGLLVPPADARALASAIERLLDDPPARDRLGAEGRRIALAEFAPEAMVQRTMAVYMRALKA